MTIPDAARGAATLADRLAWPTSFDAPGPAFQDTF